MDRSEDIKDLATALARAQGAMDAAAKDKTNPHFKSKYATLASVWDAIREPLSKNGLSIVQLPRMDEQGRIWLDTMLLHASGQWLNASYSLPATKNDAQGFGSALTYMRRYALAGVGVAPDDDDDGNSQMEPITPYSAGPAKRTNGNGTPDPRLAAAQWLSEAMKTINAITDKRTLESWEDKNKEGLGRLRAVNHNGHMLVEEAIAEQHKRIAQLDR